MVRTSTIINVLSYFMRLLLLVEVISSIIQKNWFVLFLSALALALTFLPAIFERNYKISLPLEFEVVLIFFIFGALYLGELREYYVVYWWWDLFLHTLSGIILGILGFIIIYILNREKKIGVELGPGFVAVFSFMFALSIGAIWEIVEFSIDVAIGTTMQKGNTDTMLDLIVDALGALSVSIIGFFYMKKVKMPLIEKFVKKITSNQ